MGRNSKYETHVQPHLKDITEWVAFMDEGDIAKRLGVDPATFCRYKKKYEELVQALIDGAKALVIELKQSLKVRAKGFHYTEKKTTVRVANGEETRTTETFERYSPPDIGAIHLLLKNYDDEWRNDDKTTVDLKREKLELDREKAKENW